MLLPIYLDYAKYYTVSPPYPWVSHPNNQPTTDQNLNPRSVDSSDANPTDTEGQLYSLHCTILCKGFEHPRVLVSILEPIPYGYPGTTVYPTYPFRDCHMKPV